MMNAGGRAPPNNHRCGNEAIKVSELEKGKWVAQRVGTTLGPRNERGEIITPQWYRHDGGWRNKMEMEYTDAVGTHLDDLSRHRLMVLSLHFHVSLKVDVEEFEHEV